MERLREYPASKVCRILKIPRSSYYWTVQNGVCRREHTAEERQAVKNMFMKHNGSFGRRVLKIELGKIGVFMSEHKISQIMKELDLRSKYGRKPAENVHTSENTKKYIHENIFASLDPEIREQLVIWSTDFTEQKVKGKKIYTCGIISVHDKVLVGYAQGHRCTAALAIEALNKAVAAFGAPNMIMTDRGSQFTSKAFYDMIEKLGITHSMSRPHTPVDNRFIETFWKSMKVEIGKVEHLTEEEYRLVVGYYIYYYNNIRPHSSLNYRTPLAA